MKPQGSTEANYPRILAAERRARARRSLAARLRRAYRALRCTHGGGLVYVARRRIDDHWFEFSRCDCGHVFTWFELKGAPHDATGADPSSTPTSTQRGAEGGAP